MFSDLPAHTGCKLSCSALLGAHEHSRWHREAQHPTPSPPGHRHSPGSTSATPKPCLTAAPVPLDSAGPQLYLKHVVSSPEDFRQGYLVVAILFSEHTSLWGKKVGKETPLKVRGKVESSMRWALRPDAPAATGPRADSAAGASHERFSEPGDPSPQ